MRVMIKKKNYFGIIRTPNLQDADLLQFRKMLLISCLLPLLKSMKLNNLYCTALVFLDCNFQMSNLSTILILCMKRTKLSKFYSIFLLYSFVNFTLLQLRYLRIFVLNTVIYWNKWGWHYVIAWHYKPMKTTVLLWIKLQNIFICKL